jgi:hypothetical protein
MAKRKAVESRWQAILDITLVPAVVRLPPAVVTERRNVLARHALLCRIHSEFDEMPGLSLTSFQAAKLFGLSPDVAGRILERLTDARVLRRTGDGRFALRVEES